MTTLVFLHAHPDDEALLTAGTMARAAAEGHRVVLAVATDGAAGLTSAEYRDDLAEVRDLLDELAEYFDDRADADMDQDGITRRAMLQFRVLALA